MENTDDLKAIFTAARAIQAGAAKAIEDLTKLTAENRAVLAQIKQEANRTTQESSAAVRQTGDQAVQKLEQGANAAMRRVLTTDLGARIEAAAAPVIEQLRDQYTAASQATERLGKVNSVTKWKDRGIAMVAGAFLAAVLMLGLFWPHLKKNDAFIDEVHSAMVLKGVPSENGR
jgi:hypothetical protein